MRQEQRSPRAGAGGRSVGTAAIQAAVGLEQSLRLAARRTQLRLERQICLEGGGRAHGCTLDHTGRGAIGVLAELGRGEMGRSAGRPAQAGRVGACRGRALAAARYPPVADRSWGLSEQAL